MSVLNRATVAISPNLRVKQQIRGAHNKIYEFMAGGLPQVLSDLPKQVEVVGGSDAGIMARPEDPDSFVSAIVSLVDDPALGHRLGMNGQRAFRERYSWESQMPALIGMYEDIIAGRR
jgi:glycosyltransferase involved in cell wall biosynthesis